MSDNVLDLVRGQFARIDDRLAQIEHRLGEHLGCVGQLERSVADLHVQGASRSVRLFRVGGDVERNKRRLDHVDAGSTR